MYAKQYQAEEILTHSKNNQPTKQNPHSILNYQQMKKMLTSSAT